jgi:hypothetical protein
VGAKKPALGGLSWGVGPRRGMGTCRSCVHDSHRTHRSPYTALVSPIWARCAGTHTDPSPHRTQPRRRTRGGQTQHRRNADTAPPLPRRHLPQSVAVRATIGPPTVAAPTVARVSANTTTLAVVAVLACLAAVPSSCACVLAHVRSLVRGWWSFPSTGQQQCHTRSVLTIHFVT